MNNKKHTSILEEVRDQWSEIVKRAGLTDHEISIVAKPLTPEEAIGRTSRKDYPLMTGKERLIEANYNGTVGHAFTDMPGDYHSTIGELLSLDLDDNGKRAFFIASLNAVYRHLFPETTTRHCKNEDPEHCGKEIAQDLLNRFGRKRIGFIGLNPAILENLAATFGPENIFAADLNPDTIGKKKFGVMIRNGETDLQALIEQSDILLATGTTLGNGTIDDIIELSKKYDKSCIFFGVTIAATACLLGLERVCPYAK